MDITKIFAGIHLNPDSSVPLYLQIVSSLTTKIRDLALPPGSKLPPERELSRLLGVSRTTSINAYSLLEERGLVSSRIGSGTYVTLGEAATNQPLTAAMPWEQLFTPAYKSPLASIMRSLIASPMADNTISLAAGMPDPALYPVEMIQAALDGARRHFDRTDLGLIATEGYIPLRRSLSAWQSRLGLPAAPDQVLIVSGSQQGLYLIAKAFIEPRDYAVVESPTYLGAIQVLEASGARLLCLPPGDRIDFSVFEDYLIRYRPKLFYTMADYKNPTGQNMPLQDRQELIRLAARHRLVIIEDNPYSQLYYGASPPPPLKRLDNYGGVIHLGTFSKIVFPGLRTGWVHAAPQVINRLAHEKQYVDLHSHNLAQMILHVCLEEDTLSPHLVKVRREYKKRRDAMAAAIRRYCSQTMHFTPVTGGMYLWGKLGPTVSPTELLRRAAAEGVSFVPGDAFYTHGVESHEIRLCYATHSEARLTEGIRRLGRILADTPSTTH